MQFGRGGVLRPGAPTPSLEAAPLPLNFDWREVIRKYYKGRGVAWAEGWGFLARGLLAFPP